jgi:hypothetical protein
VSAWVLVRTAYPCLFARIPETNFSLLIPGGNKTNQSSNQKINQCINESTNQQINQSINKSTNQSINQSINQQISQSINQSLGQSINQYMKGAINQSIDDCTSVKKLRNSSRPASAAFASFLKTKR